MSRLLAGIGNLFKNYTGTEIAGRTTNPFFSFKPFSILLSAHNYSLYAAQSTPELQNHHCNIITLMTEYNFNHNVGGS